MKDAETMVGEIVDLKFILRDTHGDLDAAQRRIDRALREARDQALEEAAQNADLLVRQYERDGESVWPGTVYEKTRTATIIAESIRALKSGGK